MTFPIPFLCLLSAILCLCPNTQISPDFLPFVITVTSFLWHPVIGIVPYFYYLSNKLLKGKKKSKPFNRIFDIRPTLVHMWLLTLVVWPWVNYFNWFESQLYPLFKEGWYIPSFTYCEVQWDNFTVLDVTRRNISLPFLFPTFVWWSYSISLLIVSFLLVHLSSKHLSTAYGAGTGVRLEIQWWNVVDNITALTEFIV